jgi:alanyl-tRNA synthetase
MSDTAGTGTETTEPHGSEDGTGTETETPTLEDLLAKVEELTGHSRKWEDRAKANKDAADELAALKRSQMTEAEKAEADRKAADDTLASVTKERDDAVAALARYKVATEFGLSAEDAETLSAISDETTLRALAERLSGRSPQGSRPTSSQGRGNSAPKSPREQALDALGGLFD